MIIDTVEDLFNRFNTIFNCIVYFDKTNNIQDAEYFDPETEDIGREYALFIEDYGQRELTDWEYDGIEKTMHIDFI